MRRPDRCPPAAVSFKAQRSTTRIASHRIESHHPQDDPYPSTGLEPGERPTVTVTARTFRSWLPLLTLSVALVAIGCGEQEDISTGSGPRTNASAPTPSTETNVPTVASVPAPTSAPEPESAPAAAAAPAAKDAAGVALEKVKYDELLRRIADNPSKPRYTLVDAWATWCGPCKENFPHVVEMHQKYHDKGLAVATVSFDDPTNPKQVADAEGFLREKKATFTNYLLDEPDGGAFEKFNVNGIPAVFVYGPDGKEIRRFTMDDPNKQFTYDEVEKAVVALLEGK
jgi:thiol-disulfide isomerase/thioredoxin